MAKAITPEDCLKIIQTMENADLLRSRDRAVINNQFNGGRPYSDAEVEANHIEVNFNDLSGYKVGLDGNLQVNGALLNKDKFFTARCVKGKIEKREEWTEKFTANINEPMMDDFSGLRHTYLMLNRNASLVLHGIGAMVWMDDYRWMPRFIALDDLLIPADSPQEFSEGLEQFGVNVRFTPHELYKLTHGEKVDSGWNVPYVDSILKSIVDKMPETVTPDIWQQPEKIEQFWKERSALMQSDAAPKIKLTFFFMQDEKTGGWTRKIILRVNESVTVEKSDKFVYDAGDRNFAGHIGQIIHMQYGDGNLVAPKKFHTTRGLGILLFSPVEVNNRLNCKFTQHVFMDLTPMLRVDNPTDSDRPKMQSFAPFSVMNPGVSFVKKEERHQADPRLTEQLLAQNKQRIAESSSAYVQDVDNGTQREQTLGEAQIKLQSANKIVSGMLGMMYLFEKFYYKEVLRRFLKPNSGDAQVKEFQAKCKADGIPEELMIPAAWKIDVEKVFGGGDQTLAIQETTALMGAKAQFDPTAQRSILRKWTATITRNPDLANALVPEEPNNASEGMMAAEEVFATLMLGIPVSLREGIEQSDYVVQMMKMADAKIKQIQQTTNVGTPEDVIGLQTVEQDIEQHLEVMAQDPANKALVTAVSKALGKMMNDVKAFAQRQQEQLEAQMAQGGGDPEAAAKVEAINTQAQAKASVTINQARLKGEIRKLETAQKMQIQREKHQQDMEIATARAANDARNQGIKTGADIASTRAKNRAKQEPSAPKK